MSSGPLHVRQRELPPELFRRATQAVGVVLFLFALVVLRLAFLQLSWGDYYRSLSENNRVRIERLRPTRGVIVSRGGEILVDNRPSFDLVLVPEDAGDLRVTLANLSHYLGGEPGETMMKGISTVAARHPFEAIMLKRGVDWDTVVAVESHRIDLPGVSLQVGPQRYYRFHDFAAHLLGYVGEVGPKELVADKSYRLGDLVGRAGIEKSFERFLRGRSGGRQVEVDAFGRQLRVLSEVPSVPGDTVVLTIDADLQRVAEEALGEQAGAVVVIDVRNGEVLAMASKPGFDPNLFAHGITQQQWAELINDPLLPLNNRALQGMYPPGSTFKVVTAAAGLEEGIITQDTEFYCSGRFKAGRRHYRCWKWQGHGWINVHRALVESCDVFFYELAQRLGIDKLAEYARRFGLGTKTDIGLPVEQAGLIPTREWKKRRFGRPWFPGETISASIGQGYVLVTPLQMARLSAAIANGGVLYKPHLVKRVETVDGRTVWKATAEATGYLRVSPQTLVRIREALRDAVNSRHGTGRRARLDLSGAELSIEVAGKTGTAQVSRAGGRRGSQKKWERSLRDHAWFIAFAPWSEPEVAVSVIVEHAGRHGGEVAAPIARKVLAHYFHLDRLEEKEGGTRVAGGAFLR